MTDAQAPLDLESPLRERFGLERFRPGQREVIEQVLTRRDVLCVMPTGGGKSLCYQLPAVLMPGITLVVSPLIALMKDQVDSLRQRGIEATFINSTLDPDEIAARLSAAESGAFNLLYVAPERFRVPRFTESMARVGPALLAVDEAHCISEWGHDFRPDYARLGQVRKALGSPPCIALTATATDLVRRDIADQLGLDAPASFVTGFDRPNLEYRVVTTPRDFEKHRALRDCLARLPGPAIIYANSRKRCQEVADVVKHEFQRTVVTYHAGMERDERSRAQEQFMSGAVDVVVATNAFGMGIDKPDIRSVIHYNIPGTIEAYYQEAGRAGRDGAHAQCVLLYAQADRLLQEFFIENEFPSEEAVLQVYDFLRKCDEDPIELTHEQINDSVRLNLNDSTVGSVIRILESGGALERLRSRENIATIRINLEPGAASLVDRLGPQAHIQRVVLTGLEGLVDGRFGESIGFQPDAFAAALGLERDSLMRAIRSLTESLPIDYLPAFRGQGIRIVDRGRKPHELGIDFKTLRKRKRQEFEKLDRMLQYAESRSCRRAFILGYFGDRAAGAQSCGRCDRCGGGNAQRRSQKGKGIVTAPGGEQVVLKALSGVARAKGRFGKGTVAQMLAGSTAEKLQRLGLAELSTFGILGAAGFTQQDIVTLLEALTASGHLQSHSVGEGVAKPVISLTDQGWARLRGHEPAPLCLADLPGKLLRKLNEAPVTTERPPSSNGNTSQPPVTLPDPDADALREELRRLRLEWAREENLPAFRVFGNQTLDALVRERPTSPHELIRIEGLGAMRVERYGERILEALRTRQSSTPSAAPEPVSTAEWTWRLLDRGFSVDDAASIRGLPREAIIEHSQTAIASGKEVPLAAFLAAEVCERWQAWHERHGDDHPPAELGGRPDRDWPLFLAIQQSLKARRKLGS